MFENYDVITAAVCQIVEQDNYFQVYYKES